MPLPRSHGASIRSPSPFPVLTRHFFNRFFDKESLSPQGDPAADISQILGFLAVPSAFFVLVLRPLTLVRWELVAVRYMFVSFSMIVMAAIMTIEWNALFPDRRDYQVLTPLPLRASTLLLAKLAAIGVFLGLFLVDINFFGILFWPGIDARSDVLNTLACHITAVMAGGLFAAVAVAALQGVLMSLLPATAFRFASVWIQTALIGGLVMLLILAPLIGFRMRWLLESHNPALYWFPGFWFVGLYERLRPATGDRVLLELGGMAIHALWIAAAVFTLTYVPCYRARMRKVLEAPAPKPAGPGRIRLALARPLDRLVLRSPVQRAVFHFVTQTITRSMKHRLFLATYGGFGLALAAITFDSGTEGLRRLPLTLSFVLVSALRAAFNYPSELSANWVFQISETARVDEYAAGTRKWIVLCAIAPLFALMSPMEFTYFPFAAALFHIAFGLTLSMVLSEILFFGFRKAPFTCSYLPGKVNFTGLAVIYIFGFTAYSDVLSGIEAWLERRPVAAILFLTSMIVALVVAGRWQARHLDATATLHYEDPADPVVRTLDLAVVTDEER